MKAFQYPMLHNVLPYHDNWGHVCNKTYFIDWNFTVLNYFQSKEILNHFIYTFDDETALPAFLMGINDILPIRIDLIKAVINVNLILKL